MDRIVEQDAPQEVAVYHDDSQLASPQVEDDKLLLASGTTMLPPAAYGSHGSTILAPSVYSAPRSMEFDDTLLVATPQYEEGAAVGGNSTAG